MNAAGYSSSLGSHLSRWRSRSWVNCYALRPYCSYAVSCVREMIRGPRTARGAQNTKSRPDIMVIVDLAPSSKVMRESSWPRTHHQRRQKPPMSKLVLRTLGGFASGALPTESFGIRGRLMIVKAVREVVGGKGSPMDQRRRGGGRRRTLLV